MALTAEQMAMARQFVTNYCQSIPRNYAEAISGQLADAVYSRVWELGTCGMVENFDHWLHFTTAKEARRQLFDLRHARPQRSKRTKTLGQVESMHHLDPRPDSNPEYAAVRAENVAVLNTCLTGIDPESQTLIETVGRPRRAGESVQGWADRAGVTRQAAWYRRNSLFREMRRRMSLKGVTSAD